MLRIKLIAKFELRHFVSMAVQKYRYYANPRAISGQAMISKPQKTNYDRNELSGKTTPSD